MTFKDIFKKSFIEGWSGSEIDALSAASVMAITLLLALFIFLIYKITTKKQFYSRGFNISLVGTALITAAIILTVQSNIVISLGMVGALSIVRFRTAIKEPMDLMFLFWSISIGIICGAGLAQIGIILSITMTVVVFALDRIPSTVAPLIMVVNMNDVEGESKVVQCIETVCKYYKVKSKSVSGSGSMNMTIELKLDKNNTIVQDVAKIEGVTSVSLLEHDGEVVY